MKLPWHRRKPIRVAAYDSTDEAKAKADYLCDGIDDQIEIQSALDICDAHKRVVLELGTYKLVGIATKVGQKQELERAVGELTIKGFEWLLRKLLPNI